MTTRLPAPEGWTYDIPERGKIVLVADITPSGLFSTPTRCVSLGGGYRINADKVHKCPVRAIEVAVQDGATLEELQSWWRIWTSSVPSLYEDALYQPVSAAPYRLPDEWLVPHARRYS